MYKVKIEFFDFLKVGSLIVLLWKFKTNVYLYHTVVVIDILILI